jgi:hypothetical protein
MQKQGIVEAFNISPKGEYEGMLMKSGGEVIQVNFRKEWGPQIKEAAAPGAKLAIEVEEEETHEHACHPVFRLVNLAGANGDFSGKVTRLNYALHGEVNGAILDTGDFLHVKPHGATALKLKTGMKVKGTGARKPMADGHQVIEAEEVNGIRMEKKPKPKKKVHH